MNNYLIRFICVFILFSSFIGCENKLEMTLPQGPKGDKGDKGEPGLSAFDLWKEYYGKDPNTSIEDFFNSLKGKDGKDGAVPIIGDNGNWIIDGVDTGIPAKGKDGVTPEIGSNGNWWIDGKDTGVPAQGPKGTDGEKGDDGVNGKTAYELWKEAVDKCNGTIKNKDGSDYDCSKNTWSDFLIWLQGGNFSVLHQYWLSKGNEGDLDAFLTALFDCHCDGITIIVVANNECVELNPNGTLKGTYNATIKVGGKAGTSVRVSEVDGAYTAQKNIQANATEVSFTIPRTDSERNFIINCTEPGASEQITKTAKITALKYIKLGATAPVSVEPVEGSDQQVSASIVFATAPAKVTVSGEVIYDGTDVKVGWIRSDDGKVFTKIHERKATVQPFDVKAEGADGECTTIKGLFSIPQLNPVTLGSLVLNIIDKCDLALSVQGTEGMTVKAKYKNPKTSGDSEVQLLEKTSGSYSVIIPRAYTNYSVIVTAEKEGFGTKKDSIEVEGGNLLDIKEPLTVTIVGDNNTMIAKATRRFTNNTDAPLNLVISRGGNNADGAKRHNSAPTFNIETVIPADGYVDIDFYRDYTESFASGRYRWTAVTKNTCGIEKTYTGLIDNLQDYRARFTKPDGWGEPGEPGSPGWDYSAPDADPKVSFTLEILDGLPNKYFEFQLFKPQGYSSVLRGNTNSSGYFTGEVEMKASELQLALEDGWAYFNFYNDEAYKDPISMDGKEKKKFEMSTIIP